jgi:hypothetical protein
MTRRIVIIFSLVAIIIATLISPTGGPSRPFSFCLTCNFRWLADALANVVLFVPLGCALSWRRGHIARTVSIAAGLSIAVELLQTALPGRDPTLGDVIANTAGGALGAALGLRPSAWILPSPRHAAWLLALATTGVLAIVAATEWFLAPSSQVVTGSWLSNRVAALFHDRTTMTFTAVTDTRSSARTLFSAGPPAPFHELSVAQHGDDAAFAYHARARDVRLDEPEYVVSGFLAGLRPVDTLAITISRAAPGWCLTRTGQRACAIGPTLGRGWSLVLYPSSIGRRWQRAIDALWTGALFFPIGFWSRRRTVPIAMIATFVILGPLARFAPLVPTPVGEWLGAFAGLGLGILFSRRLRRSRT